MPVRFDKLSETLRSQATPRSLIGLGVLGAMLAAVGISSLIDAVADKQEEVRQLDRSLAVQRSLADGREWIETLATLRAQRSDIEERFWRGATPGIVSAQIQNEIEAAANSAGLSRVRIEVQPLPTPLTTGARLQFEVSITARDPQGQFLNFFQQIMELDGTVVPADFEWQRLNSSVRAQLLAPALVETRTAAEGSST